MNTIVPNTQRLLALDVLRGITIAAMILVNNPGSWGSIYAPLTHKQWNGLTPTDLIFPFFLFIMGASMYISLSRLDFRFSLAYFKKSLRRSVLIFVIGITLGFLARICYSIFDITSIEPLSERLTNTLLHVDNVRILGVLQRLAICSLLGSLIVVSVPYKHLLKTVVGILLLYTIILFWGNGFELSPQNIIARIDLILWGEGHMYKDVMPDGTIIPFDPEGLLSTLPGIAQVLLGVYCGGLLLNKTNLLNDKIVKLFIFGGISLFIGELLNYGIPINKKIWSPTYVLVSCGYASILLGLLVWFIDEKGYQKWCRPFNDFGVNPLIIYIVGTIFGILFDAIRINVNGHIKSIQELLYTILEGTTGNNYLSSLLFALFIVLLSWLVAKELHRRNIYIKL